VEHPQVPAIADLPLDGHVHPPAGLVGVPKVQPLRAFHQRLVERGEERFEPLQAVGDGAQRQVQTGRGQVGQQAVGGAVEEVLVDQHGDPNGDAEVALGDHARGRRSDHNGLVVRARAGRPVASTADDAAVRLHVEFEDFGVFGTGERGERLVAQGHDLSASDRSRISSTAGNWS